MDNIKTFYLGGVTPDFDIHKLDVFTNQNNIIFNIFDSSNKDKAFNNAYQVNVKDKTYNNGVIRLDLDSNLNIVTIDDIGLINKITKKQLIEYKNMGYDIIDCKVDDGYYILINKDKIKSMTFEPIINRYTKEQIILSLNRITYKEPIPDIALEYRYESYYKEFGSIYYITEAVIEFYNLDNKNDIDKLEQIIDKIEDSKGTKMIFPIELRNFVLGLYIYINDLLIKEENIICAFKKEKDNLIKSKLPVLKEKMDLINKLNKGSVNIHEITNEYNYFYRINKFKEEDIERLNKFDNRLNLIIRVLKNEKERNEQEQDIGNKISVSKEQINKIKSEINNYNNLINTIINKLKTQREVDSNELNKIIFKNKQTNNNENSEVFDDYIEIKEAKKQILNELKEMTTSITKQKVKK